MSRTSQSRSDNPAAISADVRTGTAVDAVLISLAANAEHGKRRKAGDYRKAYDIACRYDLLPSTDSDAVAKLLRCSIQWARNLTAEARERERAERGATIQRGIEDGKTEREIADETGIAKSTVHDLARKGKHFLSGQDDDAGAADEPDPFADARVSQGPTGQRWHRALEALRAVNAQAEVSAMFADRFTCIDHAIEPELRRAHAWINELHRRFFDV
jgi:DNA-directed RNA polymerase specialized sigma24 family protein